MNTDKLCQSCAMPLNQKGNDYRGTEADGSKAEKFCSMCYRNGAYIEPQISFDDMVKRGIEGTEKNTSNFIKKFLMRKSYPTLLKQLDRWK